VVLRDIKLKFRSNKGYCSHCQTQKVKKMVSEVILPKWGMTMQEGTIARWLIEVGVRVHEGDPLAIVETEKVETELLSPASGIISEIIVLAGSTVEVGAVLAMIVSE